jgi:hypothetical protein
MEKKKKIGVGKKSPVFYGPVEEEIKAFYRFNEILLGIQTGLFAVFVAVANDTKIICIIFGIVGFLIALVWLFLGQKALQLKKSEEFFSMKITSLTGNVKEKALWKIINYLPKVFIFAWLSLTVIYTIAYMAQFFPDQNFFIFFRKLFS